MKNKFPRYPWQNDPNFDASSMPYKMKSGKHPLVRSSEYSNEFSKLSDEVKQVIIKKRDQALFPSFSANQIRELKFCKN